MAFLLFAALLKALTEREWKKEDFSGLQSIPINSLCEGSQRLEWRVWKAALHSSPQDSAPFFANFFLVC
jgi:hypothetical protein